MENRLDFFRQQMAAFEGSADPSKATNGNYYVPFGNISVADSIAGRLALRPTSSHLLLGGIGSGKTTELLIASKKIEQLTEKVYIRYIDVTRYYTDYLEVRNNALIVIAGLNLANSVDKTKVSEIIRNNIVSINKFAYGYENEYEYEEPSPLFSSIALTRKRKRTEYHKGILSSTQEQVDQKNLMSSVQILSDHLRSQYEQIIFLFDGLDRLDNANVFYHLVKNDLTKLSEMGIGSTLVGNAYLLADKPWLEEYSKNIFYQRSLDIENDDSAKSFLMSVVNQRTTQNFIAKEAIEVLVYSSGGILRDLITLTQTAIETAYFSGENQVTLEHVETAIADFGRSRTFNLTNEELTTLRSFMAQEQTPVGEVANKLLLTGRLIEYQQPFQRCIVHPALQPLLTVSVAS
jgi:Cdc6-like AAA superfamily ATPase